MKKKEAEEKERKEGRKGWREGWKTSEVKEQNQRISIIVLIKSIVGGLERWLSS